jgi:hypothetical protein
MPESESDQDLNVSQYDVEDNLNAYESLTYRAQDTAVGESSSIQVEQGRMQVSINTLSFLIVWYMINSLIIDQVRFISVL